MERIFKALGCTLVIIAAIGIGTIPFNIPKIGEYCFAAFVGVIAIGLIAGICTAKSSEK